MEELEHKRNELKESQDEVSALNRSLSSQGSIIKDLCASTKFLSQELEIARQNIKVLESDRKIMKVWCDKAMDKAVRAGRILMKRPDIVVPDDIAADVLAASGSATKAPASCDPMTHAPPKNALV
jgi:chromosome segregation ATPase